MSLLDLAGSSAAARALLEAARDGIDPASIDGLIAAYTMPTVGQPDTRPWLLLIELEQYVELRTTYDDGAPARFGWNSDEIDAQILHALFALTTGQQWCRCRLPGGLNAPRPAESVDDLHAEAACPAKEKAA